MISPVSFCGDASKGIRFQDSSGRRRTGLAVTIMENQHPTQILEHPFTRLMNKIRNHTRTKTGIVFVDETPAIASPIKAFLRRVQAVVARGTKKA